MHTDTYSILLILGIFLMFSGVGVHLSRALYQKDMSELAQNKNILLARFLMALGSAIFLVNAVIEISTDSSHITFLILWIVLTAVNSFGLYSAYRSYKNKKAASAQ